MVKNLITKFGSIVFLAVGFYFLGSKVELCNLLVVVALVR